MSTQTQCRQIAAFLRQCAARLDWADEREDDTVTVSYKVPGIDLVVSCPGTRAAVLAVAAKFEKGPNFRKPWGSGPRQNRKPPAPLISAFEAFADDGEWDNAKEYLRQWPREKWPRAAVERLVAWETQ